MSTLLPVPALLAMVASCGPSPPAPTTARRSADPMSARPAARRAPPPARARAQPDPRFAKLLQHFTRIDLASGYQTINKNANARAKTIVGGGAKALSQDLVQAFYNRGIPSHMIFPLYALYKKGRLLGLIYAEYTTGIYMRFATYKETKLATVKILRGLYDGGIFHDFEVVPGAIKVWKQKIGGKKPLETFQIKL